MAKVSIIVPVYNAENFIKEAIESILNQSYGDFELILINDGSTDNSLEICEDYAKKDERIRIINNSNHGVSYSRNCGIKISTGKYLSFIDADDIISNNFLEKLIYIIEEYNADCVSCQLKNFYGKNIQVLQNKKNKIQVFSADFSYGMFTLYGGFLANKLYKSELIKNNNLFLRDDIYICEDMFFNILYFSKCKKICFLKEELYFYRQYKTSSYNNFYSIKWFSILDAYEKIYGLNLFNKKEYNEFMYNYKLILLEAKYRLKYISNTEKELIEEKIEKNSCKIKLQSLSIRKIIRLVAYKYFTYFIFKRREKKWRDGK